MEGVKTKITESIKKSIEDGISKVVNESEVSNIGIQITTEVPNE